MVQKSNIQASDSRIGALARLTDAGIMVVTMHLLIELLSLSWLPIYYWLILFSIMVFNFFAENSYGQQFLTRSGTIKDVRSVIGNWMLVCFFSLAISFIVKPTDLYNRELLELWFIVTPLEIICWHATVGLIVDAFRTRGLYTRKMVIYGVTPLANSLAESLQESPWAGYQMDGFYDDRLLKDGRRGDCVDFKGGFNDLVERAKAGELDVVFLALPLRAERRIKQLTEQLADTTVSVYMMLDVFTFDLMNAKTLNINGNPAISIFESPHVGVDSVNKRILDLVMGSLILALIAIPMIFIAIGVKLSSPGPVFFKQKRYGVNGHSINVLKFRSMTVMNAGDGEVKQATKGDARVTKFGAFLRKTSLDELPQFLNVIQGTMSIVGPRPHAITHNEFYRGRIHGYMLRHKVKPGITGLAQIRGFRGETDTIDKMENRINSDLEYIRNWSIALDIKIIFLTIFKGFINKNAY